MENLTYLKAVEFLTTNKGVGVKIGSGTTINRELHRKGEAINILNDLIKHYFIDWEFYYNYSDNKKEYIDLFNEIMLPQIKSDFGTFFHITKDWSGLFISTKNEFIGFDKFRKYIDDFIREYSSSEIKKEYKSYRLSYSNVEFNY